MKRSGFTLVELVVVVLILAILAVVAAPRFLDQTNRAAESGLKRSLAIVRDAIVQFGIENNDKLPLQGAGPKNQAQLLSELTPFLRAGKFPQSPVDNDGSLVVTIQPTGTFTPADITNSSDWLYYVADGAFIADSDEVDENGIKHYDY